MTRELAKTGVAVVERGEVVSGGSLGVLASEVAARQPARETRRTYAGVYRSFCGFLGEHADGGVEAVTPVTVRAYRDALEAAGRSPATIAKHLSALRSLADALGSDAAVRQVKSGTVGRGEPRALAHEEYERLLRMPDKRTRHGKRDLALLHLLGSVGLRRAEVAQVRVDDVDERKRSSNARFREAVAQSTPWWVTVRQGKRGRTRSVPLPQDTLQALVAWMKVRPPATTDALVVSLPRTGRPPTSLDPREVGRIVGRHARAAGLPEDRQRPHVLRHTFCTHLAEAGATVEEIRELAGHADIRTTMIYTAVNRDRLEHAIANSDRRRRGLGRLVGD